MKAEKNRIVAVLAANLNPLVDPADLDVHSLVDAVGGVNSNRSGSRTLSVKPQGENRPDQDQEENHEKQKDELRGL